MRPGTRPAGAANRRGRRRRAARRGVGLLAARLAARVPSLSCRVGPEAYRDGARWLSRSRQGLLSRAARVRAGGRLP